MTDQSPTQEPDLYLIDCCFGETGMPGVDCDCVWGNDEEESP